MNADQLKGKTQQVIGKLRQESGEIAGNDRLANQGVADQIKGAARETWGNMKDAASKEVTAHQVEKQRDANDARDHIADKVQKLKRDAKEIINNNKH